MQGDCFYEYDAFGRRISKTNGQIRTEFLWQGDRLIAEETGDQYRTYVYEPDTFKPLALVEGYGPEQASVYYYHLDHLGTPQELTNSRGDLVWSVTYRAYGNIVRQMVAEIDNPIRFQGQYHDPETGLHYNRHRYYNPNTGRFLTPDPIGLAGGLNNYQYVPNPTGWVDPLGLVSKRGDCPGNKVERSWGDLPPLPDDEPGRYLYRGVHAEHPDLPSAMEGAVAPGNANGSVSPEAHNLGGQSAGSPYTSWTRSSEIAQQFASGKGDGGVVLRVPVGAPSNKDEWSWEWSPDEWGEQEILLKGPRNNIEAFRP